MSIFKNVPKTTTAQKKLDNFFKNAKIESNRSELDKLNEKYSVGKYAKKHSKL